MFEECHLISWLSSGVLTLNFVLLKCAMSLLFSYPDLSPRSSPLLYRRWCCHCFLSEQIFLLRAFVGGGKVGCHTCAGRTDGAGPRAAFLNFFSVNLRPTFLLTAQFLTCNSWLLLAFRFVRCLAVLLFCPSSFLQMLLQWGEGTTYGLHFE